jgi:5S rRNA maturation endonuclease (ribonuclease M5)
MTEDVSTDLKPKDLRYAFTPNVRGEAPVKIRCPLPGHTDPNPSFAVYANGGYCFGCDTFVPDTDFPTYFGTNLDELPERKPQQMKRRKPKGEYESCSPSVKLKVKMFHETLMNQRKNRIRWFQARGITRTTIEQLMFGHSGDSFSLPIWYGEQLIGIRYRLDPEYNDEETLARHKYLNPSGQDTLIYRPRPGEVTIITEGEFDAAILYQYGYDGVTATSGSGSLHKYLSPKTLNKEWVFVATDTDQAGNEAYSELCRVWGKHLPRIRWDKKLGKDLSEALENHPKMVKGHVLQEWIDEAYGRWQR